MIKLDTASFVRALELGGFAVEKRASIPVLACVRLTARTDLKIQSTDLDAYYTAIAPIIGSNDDPNDDPFDLILPQHEAIRLSLIDLGGPETTLSVDKQTLTVESGSLKIVTDTYPATDWPRIWGNEVCCFSVQTGPEFVDALARVRPAVSKEEVRYYLNGIHIAPTKKGQPYRVLATDGHRMHVVPVEFAGAEGAIPPNLIISRRVIKILVKILDADGAAPLFSVWKNGAFASFTSIVDGLPWSVQTKVIDATYPNFERVIPVEHKFSFMVGADELRKAVAGLSAPHAGREREPPTIRFDLLGDGRARVSAKWDVTAQARAEVMVPITGLTGEPCVFGFNGNYVQDMLVALDGGSVKFEVSDAGTAVKIADPDKAGPFVILMPMRVD